MSMTFVGPVPVPAAQSSPLNVLITGASRGIGLELVEQYAKAHKDNVIIAGVRDPSSASVKGLSAYPNVHVVQLDVSSESSIRGSVKEVERHIPHLDVLINNAGIYGAKEGGDPTKVTVAQFQEVLNTNTIGVLVTTQAYLPLLHKSSDAKVLNVSSGIGSNTMAGMWGTTFAAYGTSKAALNYLTSSFKHADPKVTYLTCSPGWVQTDMGKGSGSPPTTVSDSAQALRFYVAQKGLKNSGEYFDAMTGDIIPH